MKSYPDYKDSGFEFIGKIPTHWSLISLKYLLQDGNDGIKIGPFGSSLKLEIIKEDGYKVYGQGNVINNDFTWGHRHIDEDKFQELSVYEIHQDDIIITMMGTTGQAKVVPQNIKPGIFDSHIIRVRVNKKTFPQYVSMLINDSYYVYNQVKINSKGSIMEGLNSSIVKAIQIALPPTSEQQAIADFLDRKTAQIDTLIEKKQRQIDLLQEQRTALINHAVTKGLNPDVRMKDSGVEWSGEIPSHWEVMRLKFMAPRKTEQTEDVKSFGFQIALENIESKTGKLISNGSFEGLGNIFRKDDVLFNKLRPYLCKVVIAPRDGVAVSELLVLRPREDIDKKFLFYRLLDNKFISVVDGSTYGAKMPRASWDFIGNLKIPTPPFPEQQAIADFLDRKTAQIDTLIIQIEQQIQSYQEYRTALISEAVTGKIDVRTAV